MLKPIDKRIKLQGMCPIYGLEVEDDSFPDLPRGSVLWVEEEPWDKYTRDCIREGDRVVFCRKDGRYYLGKVRYQDDQVRLEPLGKGEAPLLLTQKEKRQVHRGMSVDYPRTGVGYVAWGFSGGGVSVNQP